MYDRLGWLKVQAPLSREISTTTVGASSKLTRNQELSLLIGLSSFYPRMESEHAASYLHLTRSGHIGVSGGFGPVKALIHSQSLFSILDHALRRDPGKNRVIGTLVGTRSEDGSEVEIKSAFAVPHSEESEETGQVVVEMEYHKTMLALHQKAHPKEVLIGWYATSSDLNQFSALIQNFYASAPDGTYPHPAVHLAIDTAAGTDFKCQTYISSTIGISPERIADSCLFIPIPYEIGYSYSERSGLQAVRKAGASDSQQSPLFNDIEARYGYYGG